MIFPARAGGMSSLASLVPPGFGAQGPCAVHRGHRGWPGCRGRAAGSAACRGAAGLHPIELQEKHQLSPGMSGKGGEGGGGLRDLVPVGRSGSRWWVTQSFHTGFTLGFPAALQ